MQTEQGTQARWGMAAVLVVWLTGCASAANTLWWTPMEGGMRVYGGVRADAEVAGGGVKQMIHPDGASSFLDGFRDTLFPTLDLPLSAVVDTLTLPFTVAAALRKDDGSKPSP